MLVYGLRRLLMALLNRLREQKHAKAWFCLSLGGVALAVGTPAAIMIYGSSTPAAVRHIGAIVAALAFSLLYTTVELANEDASDRALDIDLLARKLLLRWSIALLVAGVLNARDFNVVVTCWVASCVVFLDLIIVLVVSYIRAHKTVPTPTS